MDLDETEHEKVKVEKPKDDKKSESWEYQEVDFFDDSQMSDEIILVPGRTKFFRVLAGILVLVMMIGATIGILSGGAFSRLFKNQKPVVNEAYTWQLSEMFADLAAAKAAAEALLEEIRTLEATQSGPVVLPREELERIQRLGERLHVYATLRRDTALGDPEIKAFKASVDTLVNKVVLLKSEEVQAGQGLPSLYMISGIYEDIYGSFKFQYNLDFGNDPDIYSENPSTRFKAYEKWVKDAEPSAEVMADIYEGKVKFNNYMARSNGELGALENFLWMDEFSMTSFELLQRQTKASLALHHRWIELKRQLLGLKSGLRLSDLSAPLPGDGEVYKVETGRTIVDAAFQTLPAACGKVVKRAFDERWIDFYPNENKYIGAYTFGAYDVHPYLLLNYHDNAASVAELAHEMGHAIHMTLSGEAQPFATYSGDVLISELAAAVTEILFHEHQLKSAVTEKQRLAALSQYLEFFSRTFFDQMLATEFELKAHEMSEAGEDLSAKSLKTLWSGLTSDYYGQAYEVTSLDGYDWMRYQHLYWELYMYKYATGLVAGYPMAMAIEAGDQNARDAFLRLLSAGGSKTGAELLMEEKFDFTSEDLYKSFFDRYRELLDELELLVEAAS